MNAIATLAAVHTADPTCNLHWIGRQLGWDFARRSDRALEQYVEGLIAELGFPRPLPHRKHGGGISTDVSYPRSSWIRVGVLQWLGDFLPPEAGAAVDAAAMHAAADDMDAAALNLRLVGGTHFEGAA